MRPAASAGPEGPFANPRRCFCRVFDPRGCDRLGIIRRRGRHERLSPGLRGFGYGLLWQVSPRGPRVTRVVVRTARGDPTGTPSSLPLFVPPPCPNSRREGLIIPARQSDKLTALHWRPARTTHAARLQRG
jgi:hypothetical protein